MPADHLAIVLPGSGYGPDGPVLSLPAIALEQLGAHASIARYPDWRPRDVDDALADVAFRDRVVASVRQLVDRHSPTRVTFVAKSLGTLVLALAGEAMAAELGRVEAIWLTPTFDVDAVRDAAIARGWRSLVVCGTVDPRYAPSAMEAVAMATGGETLTIEGADHSLFVEGDVFATIDGLRLLADAVLRFSSP